jgi:thiol-disulfide isomerase/thioredoxin
MKRLLVLIALFLLAGSVITVTAEDKAEKAEVGKKYVDFTAKTLTQDKFVFSEAIEGKTTILKFGAVWCGWCKKMWDELKKVQDEMGDKVVIVEVDTLSAKETEEIVRKYNTEKGTPWEVVLDDKGISGIYIPGGAGIPHSLLIGPDGIIKKRIPGYKTYDVLKPMLEAVIAGEELPPDPPSPGQMGYTVSNFTLKDLKDKDFDLAKTLKDGPVVFKFSALWAPESIAMDAHMEKLYEKYGKKATIVNIHEIGSKSKAGDVETKEKVVEHYKDKKVKYEIVLDEGFKGLKAVGINSLCIVILDKYGRIAGIFDPKAEYDAIEKALDEAFEAKKPEDKKPKDK